jgi:ATP-binding cassette subfamily B protein
MTGKESSMALLQVRPRNGLQVRPGNGIWSELRQMARQGRQAWALVPGARKLALGTAVLVMCLTSAANTAIPLFIGTLVNAVNPEADQGHTQADLTRTALFYLAIIGLAYFIRETMNVLRRYLVENTCTRIDKDMCVRLVSHLLRSDLSAVSHEQVGALHGRISRSVEGLVRFLRISFLDFFPAILSGSFAVLAALMKQPRIALVMVGVVPLSLLLTFWQLITQKGVRLGLLRTREAMDGTVVEQLSGIDYIRAANTDRAEIRRVERVAERRRANEVRHHFEMSLFGCGKALNEGFFHLLVIAFAVYLFVHGGIRYGDILAFSGLFLSVMAPLNEVHRFIDEAHESSLRVGDLLEILAQPSDRSFLPTDRREPALIMGAPLFVAEDLKVIYRTSDGKNRRGLNGVSLEIRHGETIGVVGRSGCGKSTWLRVLMRLTHPCGGRAMLGGVPLESVGREAIGDLIGYVGQNPFVFAGTIAENIAYGSPDATLAEIREAAELACIHDEIIEMPGGYQATVAERGQNLSGGQRQRIALARVFLKNPPILILDEGTSALDNISERRVQRAISAARADRTVILVAHRLSTLLETDRIFVFDDGRVVETGSYEELVHRGGVFTDLVRSASEGVTADHLVEAA